MRDYRRVPNLESVAKEGEKNYLFSVFMDFLYMKMEEKIPSGEKFGIWNNIPETIDTILKRKFNIKATYITQGELSELLAFLNDQIRILTRSYSRKSNGFIEALIACVEQFKAHPHVSPVQAIKIKRQNHANEILRDVKFLEERDPIALDTMESIPNLPGFDYFYYKKYTGKTVTKRVIENGTAINREYTPVMALWKKEGKPERFAGRLLMRFPIERGKVDIHWSERLFQEIKTTKREEVDGTITTRKDWTIRKYELDHEVNQELQGAGFLYESGEAYMQQERNYIMTQRDEYENKKPEREFLESIKQSSTRISLYSQDFINPVIDQYLQDDNFSPENHVLELPGLSHFFFRFPKNPAYTPGKVRIFAVWNSDLNANQPWHRGYMTIQWPIVDQANPLVIINEKENISVLPDKHTKIPDEDGKNLLLSFILKVSPETTGIGTESNTQATGLSLQAGTMEEPISEIKKTTGNISLNVISNLATSALKNAHISLDIDGYDEFIITPLGGVSNNSKGYFQLGYIPVSIRYKKGDQTGTHIIRVNPNIDPQNPVLEIDPKYVKRSDSQADLLQKIFGVIEQGSFPIKVVKSIVTKGQKKEDKAKQEKQGRQEEIVGELRNADNSCPTGISPSTTIQGVQNGLHQTVMVTNNEQGMPLGEASIVEAQQGPSGKKGSESEPEQKTKERGTPIEEKPSLVSRAGGWLRNTFSKIFGGTK